MFLVGYIFFHRPQLFSGWSSNISGNVYACIGDFVCVHVVKGFVLFCFLPWWDFVSASLENKEIERASWIDPNPNFRENTMQVARNSWQCGWFYLYCCIEFKKISCRFNYRQRRKQLQRNHAYFESRPASRSSSWGSLSLHRENQRKLWTDGHSYKLSPPESRVQVLLKRVQTWR